LSTWTIIFTLLTMASGVLALVVAVAFNLRLVVRTDSFLAEVIRLVKANQFDKAFKLAQIVDTPLTQAVRLLLYATKEGDPPLKDLCDSFAIQFDTRIRGVGRVYQTTLWVTVFLAVCLALQTLLGQPSGWYLGLSTTSLVLFALAVTLHGSTSNNLVHARGRVVTLHEEFPNG